MIAPRRFFLKWLLALQCYGEAFLDSVRFVRSAKLLNEVSPRNQSHLESDIIRRYHVIEKGLSMGDFRPRFGADMVRELLDLLYEWERNQYSCEGSQIRAARATLQAYADRHAELGLDVSDLLAGFDCPAAGCATGGGVRLLQPLSPADFSAFERIVETRHSVRDFEKGRIPEQELIDSALRLAIQSPSVCNRQTWRVHIYQGERAQEVLRHQNGNRGFGPDIPMVLIITSDLRYFMGAIERYQGWIDGGMFSMSLLLALHAQGLGAIPLNWSVLNRQDRRMRKVAGIPASQRIIMLVGCGYSRPGALVPQSARMPLERFVARHVTD
ncbi:MAG: nitroreductase [Lentimonas sp.]|jgi:nitroreductase